MWLGAVCLLGGAAGAEEPAVGLEALLKLPDSYGTPVEEERRGSGDEAEWRRRFVEAEDEVEGAHAALASTLEELEEVAGGSGGYAVAPPGAQTDPTNNTISYKLRQELRRRRAAVEDAERAQRALVIEADVAGVPEGWRRTGDGSDGNKTLQQGE